MIKLENAMRETPLVPERSGKQTEEMLPEEMIAAELADAVREMQKLIKEEGASKIISETIHNIRDASASPVGAHAALGLKHYYVLSRTQEFKDDYRVKALPKEMAEKRALDAALNYLQNRISTMGEQDVIETLGRYYPLTQIPEFQNDPDVKKMRGQITTQETLRLALLYIRDLFEGARAGASIQILNAYHALAQYNEFRNDPQVTQLKNSLFENGIIKQGTREIFEYSVEIKKQNLVSNSGWILNSYNTLIDLVGMAQEEATRAQEARDVTQTPPPPPDTMSV